MHVNLEDFVEKVRAYQSSEYALEDLYKRMLGRRDIWDRLGGIDETKTNDVLKFLNQWKCRVKYDCTPILARTIRECSELVSRFGNHQLQEVKLESLIAGSETIQELFKKIASVPAGRRTVGATATSKILHLANPNFFIMSDENIRDGYGCSDNEFGYVNFMWRMKLFGDAIIHEYSTLRNVSMHLAFARLVSECTSAATTLPKLLDEYNWVKFNP